jgi:hypothetical protein
MKAPATQAIPFSKLCDHDARARDIRAASIATAESFPPSVRPVEVYLGGCWPGREWNGWTVEEAPLAAAEAWRTEGRA